MWITWATLGHDLKALNAMNKSRSLGHGSGCYEQLWVVVNMNGSMS